MLCEVYQVTFTNGGKNFSHLFHTRWRAENDKKDMEEQGCQNVKINAYRTILVEV